MKSYLFLFLGTLFLLFALPKNSSLDAYGKMGNAELVKSCTINKLSSSKPCFKKCLKHQTHSEKQGAAVITDCNQPVYALVNSLQVEMIPAFPDIAKVKISSMRKHLAPDLKHATEPPRFS